MLLNLSDILTYNEKREEKQITYEADNFESGTESYKIVDKTPLNLVMEADGKGKVVLEGEMNVTLLIACSRCLKETKVSIPLAINEIITKEEILQEDHLEDRSFLEGFFVDTQKLIHNEILMNLPMKVLCHEDCKGICKKCGKDLNQGECGCDDFVPDPRMAIINDIFYGNKEV